MNSPTPGFPVLHYLMEFAQTQDYWFGNAIQLSHSLSLPSALNLSQSLFQWVGSLHQVGKGLELQLQHQSFWWIFRVWFHLGFDWFDLLAVQGTLKSLLHHHCLKSSILHCSAFFMMQHSHPYMSIGNTIALIRWTFVAKVISLLFNMLSRLIITN